MAIKPFRRSAARSSIAGMKHDTLGKIAAFGAGVALWEAAVHCSLLLNRVQPTLFGIRLVSRLNFVQSVVPALTGVALLRFAFRSRSANA